MIIVKVHDLLKIAKQLSRDNIKEVDISILEAEEDMPPEIDFLALDPDNPGMSIDYEPILGREA